MQCIQNTCAVFVHKIRLIQPLTLTLLHFRAACEAVSYQSLLLATLCCTAPHISALLLGQQTPQAQIIYHILNLLDLVLDPITPLS